MTESLFFSGVRQQEVAFRHYTAPAPLFYRDVHMMAAVFTADLGQARSLLPTERHHPLRVRPGRAVIGLHCFEYRHSDIGPYNEVSLSIGVEYGRTAMPGPAKLLQAVLTGDYHAYVVQLPVTTELALVGGVDIFNFPKYLADITFEETSSERSCSLRDRETGQLILRFRGEKLRTRRFEHKSDRRCLKTIRMTSYPRKEGVTLRAWVLMNQRERGLSLFRRHATLELGEHPRSRVFRELRIGRQLQYLFAPRCEAMLFRPEVCL